MADPFEIIVGTYEQYLLGYKVNNIVNEYKMEKTFATHGHCSSIRSVDSNKYYLASGGADDFVYLYDLRYRIECARLMHHNGTVNCVAFSPETSHLFTCSNDGTIAAIRCGNWQLEKHWLKPHKGLAVNTLAIHPTGKIALSTGADGVLRTWNLVKGRQAYATNLVPRLQLDAKNVNVLKWSPSGEKYLLAVNQRVDVYSVELAGIDSEIKFDSKIVCVEFLKDDLIAVGLENGRIKFYDLDKSAETAETIAHDIRIKCMAFKDDLLVTASSSGEIKLWKYSRNTLNILESVNIGARITCVSLATVHNNLKCEKEDQSEEVPQEIKREKKFRLKQEVIIEKEGNWDVTAIDVPRKTKKLKKKRNIKDVIPMKQKKKKKKMKKQKEEEKLLKANNAENNVENKTSNRKRKVQLEENNNIPMKKPKKLNETISRTDIVTLKESKTKLTRSKETDDEIPPKRRKKERKVVEESGAILKKKKKKKQ
ncbi:p21-activated protein kinase-interacting protein 1-like [Anthophora quadrimaculata]